MTASTSSSSLPETFPAASRKFSGTTPRANGKLSAATVQGRGREISALSTRAGRPLAWADSWRDEAFIHLPDIPQDVIDDLPLAIDLAERDLEPGDPEDILAAL